jgi:hypothetical protein
VVNSNKDINKKIDFVFWCDIQVTFFNICRRNKAVIITELQGLGKKRLSQGPDENQRVPMGPFFMSKSFALLYRAVLPESLISC